MPELPEVEIVRRGLEKIFVRPLKIEKVQLKRWDLRDPIPRALPRKLQGATIERISRRAKYLLFHTTTQGALLSHLGMTGSWRVCRPGESMPHDHAYLHLEDGRILAFRDPRRFGVLDWVESTREGEVPKRFLHLGPEPLNPQQFTAEYLQDRLRGRKSSIKVAIMNQEVVVGVGNIYASEALFRAGIQPARRSLRITRQESARLVVKIREVLEEAIAQGGSTIRDYSHTDGQAGQFQSRFAVYERKNEACSNCQSLIKHRVLGGRSTYWCSRCQR